ncbi:Ubiquitin carboxyl-terminal hydrolase 18 [Neofusicoccum parvum]|uniref:Ubiquitin carboxyl-terminal hydrolase 18 n=1 Tax=Neofusicoccum parvum TaxID=310453 RepID=A0ACB5SNE8_9PEZI|nr:Ubiquitin carboxyl-terminal hydrolase 18 [Neofusicoccum parvum]
MSSATAPAPSAPDPSNPAPTSPTSTTTTPADASTKPDSKDAPSYAADISPPAYTSAAPTYTLDGPSTNNPNHASPAAAAASLPTTPIPFHFLIRTAAPTPAGPGAGTKLRYTHPVPTALLGPSPADDAATQELFVDVLSEVLGAHQEECRAEAERACEACGLEAGEVLLTPVSFLHVEEGAPPAYGSDEGGRRVEVLVTPVCGREGCAEEARGRMRVAMEGEGGGAALQGPEDPRCRVCGRGEGTMKCAGCGVVRYCGRECQRADWKREHKRVCAMYAELVEEGKMMEGEAGRVEG